MKAIKTILLGLTCFAVGHAFAFDPDIGAIDNPALAERFPKGTITTRATADQAIKEVGAGKRRLKELADYSRRRCNENIFVNSCIEDVRKAELRQTRRLQAIESEARRVVREDETRKQAARQKERDRKAAQPPKPVKKAEPRSATEAQKRAAETKAAHEKRMKSLEERNREMAIKKAEEAKRRADYEAKQAAREKRRAERERRLARRAAKDARDNPSAQNKEASKK